MANIVSLEQRDLIAQLHELDVWSERVPVALALAEQVHGDQRREGGGRYLEEHVYPITAEVGRYLVRVEVASASAGVLIALLHDTIEDSIDVTTAVLTTQFGEQIARGVAILSKPTKRAGRSNHETTEAEARYVDGVAHAPLVVRVVKVFDRLNNLNGVHLRPAEKRSAYLAETREHYLDLAYSVDGVLAERMADLLTTQADSVSGPATDRQVTPARRDRSAL